MTTLINKQVMESHINDAHQKALNQITDSFPSIFTKEDVSHILYLFKQQIVWSMDSMTTHTPDPANDEVKITKELLENIGLTKWLKSQIAEKLEESFDNLNLKDYFEIEDESYEVNYNNQIQLEDYRLNCDSSSLCDEVADAVSHNIVCDLDTLIKEEEVNS